MDSRYKILEIIRDGKIVKAYKAEDTQIERDVCIRRFAINTGTKMADTSKAGFLDIVAKLCEIKHPSFGNIFDVGIDDDGPYLVTDHVEGTLVFDIIKEKGALSEYEVYLIAKDLLEALQTLHHYDFIHGAFRLRSIMQVDKKVGDPEYQLLDFGLYSFSKLVDDSLEKSNDLSHKYLKAPEIFDGEEPSQSSDLYALGHLLYIALSGGHPFAGMDEAQSAQAHRDGKIKPLSRYADISEPFEQWIHSLIQANPANRPATSKKANQTFKQFQVVRPKSNIPLRPIPIETGRVPDYLKSQKTTEVLTYQNQPAKPNPIDHSEPQQLITNPVYARSSGNYSEHSPLHSTQQTPPQAFVPPVTMTAPPQAASNQPIQQQPATPKTTGMLNQAQPPKTTSMLNRTQPPKTTGMPNQTQPPKTTSMLNRTQLPKTTGMLNRTQPPKTTGMLNQTQPPKTTGMLNQTQPPKTTGMLNQTQPPKTTSLLEQSLAPRKTSMLQQAVIPKPPSMVQPATPPVQHLKSAKSGINIPLVIILGIVLIALVVGIIYAATQ